MGDEMMKYNRESAVEVCISTEAVLQHFYAWRE